MEQNRLNIVRERAPSVVLTRSIFNGEIGEKGTAEGVFMIVGQQIVTDSNGNEITKHLIQIKSLKRIDSTQARIC